MTLAEKSLDAPVFFDARAHSFYHLWNAVDHLADNPGAVRLIFLNEISSMPEGLARLAERLLAAIFSFFFGQCNKRGHRETS